MRKLKYLRTPRPFNTPVDEALSPEVTPLEAPSPAPASALATAGDDTSPASDLVLSRPTSPEDKPSVLPEAAPKPHAHTKGGRGGRGGRGGKGAKASGAS